MTVLLKRWRIWLLFILAAGALSVGSLLIVYGGTKITRANCKMIRPGMTLHEVEAALGRPPSEIGHGWSRAMYGHWRDDDDNEITVTFVDEHVSNEAMFQPGNLPLSERLQRLFKRILRQPK